MTRSAHLQWCKERAKECLDQGDIPNAWASFVSDMSKHDDLADHLALPFGSQLMMAGLLSTPNQMRYFINGFN